jgi:multidrug efflux pump
MGGAAAASIALGAARITWRRRRVRAGHRRTSFGWFIKAIVGNPIMPLLAIAAVAAFVGAVFLTYRDNNLGVDFFVDTEPEQAIVHVQARGNLSLAEKDRLVKKAEAIVLQHPGVDNAFAFAGDGGLEQNTGGAQPPLDSIGQIQLELVPWEDRRFQPELDGNVVVEELTAALSKLPGIHIEVREQARGPASAKPVHLRLSGNDWSALQQATTEARARFEQTSGLTQIEDTLPLPGIDWQIDVDVEKAGRFGADVATVGAMVQLVTRGLLLDTMRVESSDEEIDIRVRLPEADRVLSTLDSLKVRTRDGLVPLANFITRQPVPKLAQIKRVDQTRYFDVKAAVETGLIKLSREVGEGTEPLATLRPAADGTNDALRLPDGGRYEVLERAPGVGADDLRAAVDAGTVRTDPVNANERIAKLTEWLNTAPLPVGIDWEWTGDQEDQAESQTFLMKAFAGALGLMFIILLAQFNSIYNAVLVLLAVVLSTTGVLIGMLVMEQSFSVIMTGTGIVALAGIVVNNNIVLIDTYQEYSRYMPQIEAIIRTAEARIRPVLLTTTTTMAGLTPMMLGISLDFIGGGYSIDSPTALWWKQLATAVVFGLGIATLLTLVFTPSLLALRVWATSYLRGLGRLFAILTGGRSSRVSRDWALRRAARRLKAPELIWEDEMPPEELTAEPPAGSRHSLRAAE